MTINAFYSTVNTFIYDEFIQIVCFVHTIGWFCLYFILVSAFIVIVIARFGWWMPIIFLTIEVIATSITKHSIFIVTSIWSIIVSADIIATTTLPAIETTTTY